MTSQRQPHILVVEDEQHLATGIRYNLVADGYRVTLAEDGTAALRVLEQQAADIDLLVLDLMLPGMSGYAVCEAVRARTVDLPVLILSSRTLSEDRTRGFDVGANQYMTKPFDLDEFLSRVKNLLTFHGRGGGPVATKHRKTFEFGNARVDFETFQVTVGGQPVRLTQLEMSLLRYFVENEGRVIPRAELLEQVWGLPRSVSTRAPDQFISRLRKTFEPDAARPQYFLTIRDAGYRFVARGEEG